MRSRRKALAAELDDVRAQLADWREWSNLQATNTLVVRQAALDTARKSARETMEFIAELQAELSAEKALHENTKWLIGHKCRQIDVQRGIILSSDARIDALIAAGDRLARCAPKNGAGPSAVGNWRRTVAGETTTETTTEVEA